MDKFTSVAEDGLRRAFADVSTGKGAKQLMTALAYEYGVSAENT